VTSAFRLATRGLRSRCSNVLFRITLPSSTAQRLADRRPIGPGVELTPASPPSPLAATLGITTGDPWFLGKRFSERRPNLVKLQRSMRLFSHVFSINRSAWLAQGRLNGAGGPYSSGHRHSHRFHVEGLQVDSARHAHDTLGTSLPPCQGRDCQGEIDLGLRLVLLRHATKYRSPHDQSNGSKG
jgi:hypothetical protein